MSRAEIAHQRAREIQSAQSVTSRTFGGQLSTPEPPSQVVARPPQSPQPQSAQPSINAAIAEPPSVEALTPAEQARRLRHAVVTERAANLLGNDQTKLNEFRDRVSAYRQGTTTAPDLIDAFFSLFDTSSKELGKLIKELADIFEIPGKSANLLKAWGDWKAINEDYPSLPGPTGANASSAAGILGQGLGASRVLKLKSSTAQSSRSSISQSASWGTTGRVSASSAVARAAPFPSLPPSGSGAVKPAPTPGWLALRPAGSAGSSARASPAPSRNQSSQNLKKDTNAFPALPPGRKPTSTVFSPGYTGSGVLRQSGTSTPVSAWGAESSSGASPTPAEMEGAEQRKGKGRKGKQVVFQWG